MAVHSSTWQYMQKFYHGLWQYIAVQWLDLRRPSQFWCSFWCAALYAQSVAIASSHCMHKLVYSSFNNLAPTPLPWFSLPAAGAASAAATVGGTGGIVSREVIPAAPAAVETSAGGGGGSGRPGGVWWSCLCIRLRPAAWQKASESIFYHRAAVTARWSASGWPWHADLMRIQGPPPSGSYDEGDAAAVAAAALPTGRATPPGRLRRHAPCTSQGTASPSASSSAGSESVAPVALAPVDCGASAGYGPRRRRHAPPPARARRLLTAGLNQVARMRVTQPLSQPPHFWRGAPRRRASCVAVRPAPARAAGGCRLQGQQRRRL